MPTLFEAFKECLTPRIIWIIAIVFLSDYTIIHTSFYETGYVFLLFLAKLESLETVIKSCLGLIYSSFIEIFTSAYFLLPSYFIYALHTFLKKQILFPTPFIKYLTTSIKFSILYSLCYLVGLILFFILMALSILNLYLSHQEIINKTLSTYYQFKNGNIDFWIANIKNLPTLFNQITQKFSYFSITSQINTHLYKFIFISVLIYFIYGIGVIYEFTNRLKISVCLHPIKHFIFFKKNINSLLYLHFLLFLMTCFYILIRFFMYNQIIINIIFSYFLSVGLYLIAKTFKKIENNQKN